VDIEREAGEDQASPGNAVILAEPETYLDPSAWPQFFGGSQPNFPGSTFCAFSVAWDAAGCLNIRLVLEGPDGVRNTVELGPLPVASLMYLASYAMMEVYSQMLSCYSQVPYGMLFESGGVRDALNPPLLPGVP